MEGDHGNEQTWTTSHHLSPPHDFSTQKWTNIQLDGIWEFVEVFSEDSITPRGFSSLTKSISSPTKSFP